MSIEILEGDRAPAADDAGPAAERGRWSAALGNATIALPPAVWLLLGWHRRWITDDGLIAARTVRQILAGHGPVFNPGERVEANTSALWTWLLAAVSWVTQANVYTVIEWTGLVLAPTGLLFALLGARNVQRRIGASGPLIPLGAAVLLALPPFWDFVTSGLETSLIFCWLGLCWWLLSRVTEGGQGRVYAAGAVVGLGWVVRPDMMLMTLAFGVALVLIVRPGRLASVKLAAATFAVPGLYEVFRMGYYGLLVPNTALVKEASSSDPGQGLTYLGNFVSPYLLWLPVLLIAASVPVLLPWGRIVRHDRFVILAAAAGGALSALYVVWIGGDFMHARMLLPSTFTLLMPVMAVPLPALAGMRAKLAVGAMAVVAVWAGVCLVGFRLHQTIVIADSGITNERAFWVLRTGDAHPVDAAPYMKMVVGTGDETLALQRITGSQNPFNHRSLFYQDAKGQMVTLPLRTSYGTIALPGDILGTLGAIVPLDGLAIDTHGLSYAVGSHMLTNGHRIGHEKTTGMSWIIADYTVPGSTPVLVAPNAPAGPPPAAEPGVDAAHRALGCGDMKTLSQATRSPMTFHLFLRNIVDSVDRTEFRVQNDPTAAVGELCGH
ncbi:arabinofuranosyltransferase [Catenulispora sp. MAP5-51]|uniref:hypothetical protein n=1 Tax=Catenulispora sp. MAP5-51 TaxID=3156298 RepID=UPI0035125BB8